MTPPDSILWRHLIAALALEAALLVGLAAVVQRFVAFAVWRRIIWQICFLGLMLAVGAELTGVGCGLSRLSSTLIAREGGQTYPDRTGSAAGRGRKPPTPSATLQGTALLPASHEPERRRVVPDQPQNHPIVPRLVEDETAARRQFPVPIHDQKIVEAPQETPGIRREESISSQFPIPHPQSELDRDLLMSAATVRGLEAVGILELIWWLGCAAMLIRLVLGRLLLALFRRRCQPVTDEAIRRLLHELARDVGFRARLRLVRSKRLTGPIAFGVIRPCIGLPEEFEEHFNPAQKQVMLAHELAHLAARDPLWSLFMDILLALLWWHPLLWWARAQFNQASEAAADETSLIVEGGPQVLAECLLQLGSRLGRPGVWMSIQGRGLKSGLAQRVERLLHLDEGTCCVPNQRRCALIRSFAPIGLSFLVIFCAAWVRPPAFTSTPTKGETVMMTMQESWNRSVVALTLATVFNTWHPAALAAEPAKPPLERNAPSIVAPKWPDPVKQNALRARLDRITLSEVAYDSLPLGEVVQQLIVESSKRDPQEAGVNFLFSQARETGPPGIDPATGLPLTVAAEAVDLRAVSVRLMPPLKNVRLIDALDAITKVADRPIKYSVQEYAVVIALAPPGSDLELTGLSVRTFRVNTNNFFPSVEKTFGVSINNDSPARQQSDLRLFLSKIGVNMDSASKTVFYNENTGILMVRAFPNDLDLAEAAIATLGGTPEAAGALSPAGNHRSLGAGVEDTVSNPLKP